MKLENEFTVPVDIDTVFDALNDPEKVTPCFPGATLDSRDGDDFTGTVKVKLGPISMTYKGKGTFVERDKTNHKVVVDAQGRDSRGNGTASAKATLTMTDDGGKTKVNVLTEMQVTGKPAQFGRGVMADVGDKILGQFASCLADEFGSSSVGRPRGRHGHRDRHRVHRRQRHRPRAGGRGRRATPRRSPARPRPPRSSSGSGAPAAAAMPTTVAEAAKGDSGAKPGASVGGAASGSGQAAAQPSQPRRQQVEAIDLLDSSRDAVLKRLVPVGIGAGVLAAIIAIILVVRGRS